MSRTATGLAASIGTGYAILLFIVGCAWLYFTRDRTPWVESDDGWTRSHGDRKQEWVADDPTGWHGGYWRDTDEPA